jgi:hypothetical protein
MPLSSLYYLDVYDHNRLSGGEWQQKVGSQ